MAEELDLNLVALYEVKRQNFLTAFIQNPKNFDPALAYAYEHRIAPVFHEAIQRETYGVDPFESVYSVKSNFVLEVLKYIDELDLARNYADMQFNELEHKFGGYKSNRIELITAIEYARISGKWGDQVYDAIEKMAPVEAKGTKRTFKPEDVYFG